MLATAQSFFGLKKGDETGIPKVIYSAPLEEQSTELTTTPPVQKQSKAQLLAENQVLREQLEKLQSQLGKVKFSDGKQVVPLSPDEHSADFYKKLRESLEPAVLKRTQALLAAKQPEATNVVGKVEEKNGDSTSEKEGEPPAKASDSATATEETSAIDDDDQPPSSQQKKNSGTGIGGAPLVNKNNVIVAARTHDWSADPDDGDDNEEDEVCVVDMKDMEWWTVVPSEKDKEQRLLECKVNEEDSPLDDSYVVLQEGDLVDALAEFVAVAISRHPNVRQLSPAEMKLMIDQTFDQLQEHGTIGKLYHYASLMYSTYGWGACAFKLYQDPFYVRLVATGLWQAVTWALIFVA